jgi:hypothetical protein
MNRLRYSALVVIGAVLMLLGPITAALAAMDDRATLPTMGVTTTTVAAPGNVSTGGTKCVSSLNNGTYQTRLQAKVSWTASTTRGVSGYRVTAVFSDGTTYPVAQVDAATTSLTGDYDSYYATQNIRVVVTTLTSYGWTGESQPSGVIKC